MWGAKEQLLKLTRSLRRGRTVELPEGNLEAAHYLTNILISNQPRTLSELLANSDFDVNFAFGRVKRNLLHIAANVGVVDCLSILLSKGSNPDYQDISGCTALHLAARNGHQKCVLKLLEHKADVNIRNNEGFVMVHWLAVNGRAEILADVLPYLRNIDIEDTQGQTALHIASQNGHKATAQILISAGSNVNHMNKSGYTPLYFACSHGQYEIVQMLLKQGALHRNDQKGVGPIDLCFKGGYGDILDLLLSNFPRLKNNLLPVAIKHIEKKIDNVLACFKHLCLRTDIGTQSILASIAEFVANTGFQLLSVSSDYKIEVNLFRQSMKLLNELCFAVADKSSDSFASLAALRIGSGSGRSFSIPETFEPLTLLWSSLEEWMKIIQDEIDSKNPEEVQLNAEGVDEGSSVDPQSSVHTDKVKKRKSLEMLVMTSDRLCALIQAYYDHLKCIQTHQRHKNSKETPAEFADFVVKHNQVIKFIIMRDPKVIFNHFSFIFDCAELMRGFVDVIRSQPFDKRVDWFYENLHADRLVGITRGQFGRDPRLAEPIKVRRQYVFEDSCKALDNATPNDLKFHVGVQFQNEEGMGVGVLREWLDILSNEIFNPEYALFILSPDGTTFQPNSNSSINPDHLSYFTFAGQIFGLALYHRQLVNVFFTRSFYKHVLGVPVSYTDVASIDPEYAKNLQWILDNDVTDLGLSLTFSVETDVFGMMQEIELKPNGSHIPVTEQNKAEYVQLVTELRMTRAIQPQIDAFRKGFQQFIPESLVQIFNEDELEMILSGSSNIDVDDWRKNTVYASGYESTSPVIQWFWKCVSLMDEETKSCLLQFSTGSSRVPYRGFKHLHGASFVITRAPGDDDELPTASTCVNMLKLPEYTSYEVLKEKLLLAITYGSQGYART